MSDDDEDSRSSGSLGQTSRSAGTTSCAACATSCARRSTTSSATASCCSKWPRSKVILELLADLEKIRAAGAELGALVNESLDVARLQTVAPGHHLAQPRPPNAAEHHRRLQRAARRGGRRGRLRRPAARTSSASARPAATCSSQVHALLDLAEDLGDDAPQRPGRPLGAVGAGRRRWRRGAPARPSSRSSIRLDRPVMLTAKLLVVDDDEANRDMLSRRLERLGYQVALAENGREALDKIADGAVRPDPAGHRDAGAGRLRGAACA